MAEAERTADLADALRTQMLQEAVGGLEIEPYNGENTLFEFASERNLEPNEKLNVAARHTGLMLERGRRYIYRREINGVDFCFLNSTAFVSREESGLDYDAYLRLGETTDDDDWYVLVFDRTESSEDINADNPLAIQFNRNGILKLGGNIVSPSDPGIGEEIDFIFQKVKEIGVNLDPKQRAVQGFLGRVVGRFIEVSRHEEVQVVGKIGLALALTAGVLYGPQVVSGDRDTWWPQPIEGLIDWNNRPDHVAQGIPAPQDGAEVQLGAGLVTIPYVADGDYSDAPNAQYTPSEQGPTHLNVRPGTYRVDLGSNLSHDTYPYYLDEVEIMESESLEENCLPVRGAYGSGETVIISQNPDHADGHLTIEAITEDLAEICDVNGEPLGPHDGSIIMSQRFSSN